jgi:hypothetical protein
MVYVHFSKRKKMNYFKLNQLLLYSGLGVRLYKLQNGGTSFFCDIRYLPDIAEEIAIC